MPEATNSTPPDTDEKSSPDEEELLAWKTTLTQLQRNLKYNKSQDGIRAMEAINRKLDEVNREFLGSREDHPLPDNYIDPSIVGARRKILEIFYKAQLSEGGSADECILRGLEAVLRYAPDVISDYTNGGH